MTRAPASGDDSPASHTHPGTLVLPTPLPVIPASPTAADIAAVLVALGLATQGV